MAIQMSNKTKLYINKVLHIALLSAIFGGVWYHSLPAKVEAQSLAVIQTEIKPLLIPAPEIQVKAPVESISLPTPTATPTPPPATPKPVKTTPKPVAVKPKATPAPVKQVSTDAVSYVKSRAASMGWTGAEWDALYYIVQRESSWNYLAVNKSSGACGLFQALPCSKMGTPWNSIEVQTNFGINYIKNRYGTPLKAKAFWDKNHWY